MFEKLSIEFTPKELLYHWEHTSFLYGLALENAIATDTEKCKICKKLENLKRHVKELLPQYTKLANKRALINDS